MESRTRTRWEQDGWELVSITQGRLQSQLEFRRPKKRIGRRTLLAVGAGAAALVVVIVLGATGVFGGDEDVPAEAKASANSVAPSTEPANTAGSPSEPSPTTDTTEVITAENSPQFAALLQLTDTCDTSIAEFADESEGRTVRLDGSIAAMAPHDGAKSRYDILIGAGDFSETSAPGPAFQFNDVNTTYDMHYTGETPYGIGVGTNLAITAEVREYNADQCLLHLKPVETVFR
ncbi:DUF4839 domain-containing protein [Curtobacterium sp. MCPF17_021]|uniref:DUF4839 domain-containing protein n=1 Tax=Curtobacterium sp. MCPF17_021 TaxID=2175639 RepID=UPI0011B62AA8|nr:DUF4839 domain-containing protein [Curtobacterium sp. MCPF17_021]WIE82813.1 DUF4839 domain-containing protein [Curtobacterium sp. MCPF17_021]